MKNKKILSRAEQEIKQINGVRRVKFSDKDAELELMIKDAGKNLKCTEGKKSFKQCFLCVCK